MKLLCSFVCVLGVVGYNTHSYAASRTEGGLQSENELGCIGLSAIKSNYTAADIFRASAHCASQEEYEKGANLFLLGAIYANYDSLRVSDSSARTAAAAVITKYVYALPSEKVQTLKEHVSRVRTLHSAEWKVFCTGLGAISHPSYYPSYMIDYGINATLSKKGEEGLVPNFDANGAWNASVMHLQCPTSGS